MRQSLLTTGIRIARRSAQSMRLPQGSLVRKRRNVPVDYNRCQTRRRLTSSQDKEKPKTTVDENNKKKEEDTWMEWIPPDRPLAGDQGQSHLYATNYDAAVNKDEPEDAATTKEGDEEEELRLIEEQLRQVQEKEETQQPAMDDDGVVDWTVNRRRLPPSDLPTHMLPPAMAQSQKNSMTDNTIPIKPFTLLSKDEIAKCLTALGGRDVTVILDNPLQRRMGGAHGLMLVTAISTPQLQMLATALVRQLRLRSLEQRNVVGAQLGAEGDAASKWLVVDCRNYVVHIFQDEPTRRAVDLESLWSGRDGLHEVNVLDENAVDDYVATHPVPAGYGTNHDADMDPWMRLQRNRFTAPHRPVLPSKRKATRKGRRRR